MEENEIHCPLCKRPDDRFMICCDSCDLWYHGKCVGQFKNRLKQFWYGPCCCNRWEGEWRKAKERKSKDSDSLPRPCKSPQAEAGVAISTSPFKVSFLPTADAGMTAHPTFHSDPPPSNVTQVKCTPNNESAMMEDCSTRDNVKRTLFDNRVLFQPAKPTNKKCSLDKSIQKMSKTDKNDNNSMKPSQNLASSLLSVSTLSSEKGTSSTGTIQSKVKPVKKLLSLSLNAKKLRKSEDSISLSSIKGPQAEIIGDAGVAKSTSPFKVSFLSTADTGLTAHPTFHLDPPPSNVTQVKCTPNNESAMIKDHYIRDNVKRTLFDDNVQSQPAKPTNKRCSLSKSLLRISKTAKNDSTGNSMKPSQNLASSFLSVSSLSSGKGTLSTLSNQPKVNPSKKQDFLTLSPDFKKSRKSEDSDSSDLDDSIFQPKRKKSVKQSFTQGMPHPMKPSQNLASSFLSVSSLSSGKGTLSTLSNQPKVNPSKKQDFLTLSPDFKKSRKSEDSDSSDLDDSIFQPKRKKSVKQSFTQDSQQSHLPLGCRSDLKESPKTEIQKSLSCQYCQKEMSCHQSLSRHKKVCKQNINRKPFEHICNACGKQIPRRYMFTAHIKKCTGKRVVNHGVGKISCPYENCKKQFQFKVDMYEHLHTEHKADLKPPEIRIFASYKDFDKWKTIVEDDSFSYFSQQYGKRNGRSYFYCQHDGSKKSHLKNQQSNKTPRRNKKGRIKNSDLCLAMMTLQYLPDGKIKVAYRPTHLHPCRPQDLKHQPLSTATNEYITKLLAWNVPPRKIVQNLRDDSYQRENRINRGSVNLKRDNLVKIKTITERMRKKSSSLRFSNDDAESVYFKVMSLMKEKYNPILIYKPKGEKTVIGPEGSEQLPEDVFLLAIQSKEQLEMMVEGCKDILAIDETHCTNPYGYQLLNMMVRDKFNLGYPVGHAISSKSDEAILQFVFKAIKERCPDMKINCCITDDAPALINSVTAGFGEAVWHLLCVWHIHRTIQSKIRENVKDSDLVSEIYSIMCVLIDEPDEAQFVKLKDSFLLEFSHKCPKFNAYFNNTFLPKARKWARCYRLEHHGETDTTMLVESFHNILKTVYMKRRPNKRLDDLLDLLLSIEEDYYTRYTNAILLNSMSDKDFSDLSKRHLKGMQINDSDVTQISKTCWTVRSQDKNSTEEYIVVRCADQCLSDSCIFNCCHCDTLCSHLFICSCPDIFPLCKHLHKVFSNIAVPEPVAKEEKEPQFFTAVEDTETVENETVSQSHENHEKSSFKRRIEAIRKIMQDLDSKFLETSPVKRLLPRIENTFKDIETQCKVLCEDPVVAVTEMDVKSKTAPNEKLKKQLLKPFEKKSRKRKTTGLQKPNRRSVEELKAFLLHEQEDEENVDADVSDYLPQLSNEQTSDEPTKDDTPFVIDIVLEYEGIKISSLHLKALHPNINSTELPSLLRADPKFVHGYLYDEVINVYLKMLCAENVDMFACDTTVAVRLCSGKNNFKNFFLKLSSKRVILFPGNLDENHWVIIAVEVATCSMWYYNPLSSQEESLLSLSERKFLSAVALLLRDVFPLVKGWSVKRHFDKQNDLVSCGVYICWFSYCIGINSVITPLEDCSGFRISIYDSIVSLIP